MKRLLFAFCSVVSIVLLMPMFVHCATIEDVKTYCEQEFYGYENIPSTDWDMIESAWGDDQYLVCGMWSGGSGYNIIIGDITSISNPSDGDYVISYNGTEMTRYVLSNNTITRTINTNPYEYTAWTSFHDVGLQTVIDYDDLIFDPSIPVPKYTSIYGILPIWNLGGSVTPEFPIQTIFSSMPDYKIEVQIRYYSPSKITFNGSRRSAFSEDWTVNYTYDSLMPSEWYPLVTMQDGIQNNNLALQDSDYYYSWNNFITGYDSELIEFVLDPVFISASANTSIKAYAETEYAKMRNIGGCYGNQFEIMARNYYVNNGNVFVGNWFHWNSLTPDMGTAEYSSDAIQDNEVNGVQNVVNTSELPSGNSLTTIGQPTGNAYNPSNNIVINTNVPNYPDYPTVADYNRDNILVGMIKTAKAMPQYFGEFNEFLTTAFSFIDPSVWAVIALGFSASIVIMIIKVL